MLTPLILASGLYIVFTDTDTLRVDAEPAVAVLTTQQAGRNLVNLPPLEFRLSLSPHCAAGGRPESLSITIADTQRTLRGDDLQVTPPIDVSMRVSASQLAPFALRAFCVDPASGGESLLLPSTLAAQLSLRCARDDEPSMVFAAHPLDIRVDCLPSGDGTETETD